MSRKDYVAIATVIRESLDSIHADDKVRRAQSVWIAIELAKLMARDNPRFRSAQFFGACGLREGD